MAESLHLAPPVPDAESSQSPMEAAPTAKSSVVLQKGVGKRGAEDFGDLNSTSRKMKGNKGRPWMDDSEGRVIHTAGKSQLLRPKEMFRLPSQQKPR